MPETPPKHPIVIAAESAGITPTKGEAIHFTDEVPAYLRRLQQFEKESAESTEVFIFATQ